MATKPEYEIKDIKITPDSTNFRVIVESDFIVDEFGQRRPEMFQFPIKDLDKEEKWKHRIERVMIQRSLAEDEEDEQDTTTPAGGFQKLTPIEKKINRLNRINTAKEKFIGKQDLTEKVQQLKQVRSTEKAALKSATKVDPEPEAQKGGKDNAKA